MIERRLRAPVIGLSATILVATTLLPLIRGTAWFVAVFVVTTVVTVLGIVLRRWIRPWPVVAALQALALLWIITVLFVRDTTAWGLFPGARSPSALRVLADSGWQTLGQTDPPWDGVRGLILLAVLASGIVGLSVDVLTVPLRAPALAGLPLLALYCVPSAMLPDGGSWLTFLAAGTGFLFLIGLVTRQETREWGEIVTDDPVDRTGSPASPLRTTTRRLTRIGRGGRRVVVVVLGLAVLVPALVPGLNNTLLSSDTGPGSTPGAPGPTTIQVVNPLLDLRRDLIDRSDTTVITYRTDAQSPPPLRLAVDDLFDGTTWAPSMGSLPLDQTIDSGLPTPPGLTAQVPTTSRTAWITATDWDSSYLPLPYPAQRVDIPGTWLWDADTFNVVGWNTSGSALSYRVDYLEIQAASSLLGESPAAPPALADHYTQLPEDLPKSIVTTARAVAGSGNDLVRAQRLQRWLRSEGGFTYSETLSQDGGSDSGQDAVATFLRTKVGYCVQFASAMAVMARSLDIPARVAVGFLPGERLADGSYRIRLRDAHAWPELYFEGVGWVRFEPTPSSRSGAAPAQTEPQESTPATSETSSDEATPGPAEPGGQLPETPGSSDDTEDPALPVQPDATGSAPWWSTVPWGFLGIVVSVLGLFAIPGTTVTIGRARRRHGAASAQEHAEISWRELQERLGELQVRWQPSWTPRAVQRWLSTEWRLSPATAAALTRLVEELERARYARPDSADRPMRERSEDVRLVERTVAARSAWWLRAKARAFPVVTALGMTRQAISAARNKLPLR